MSDKNKDGMFGSKQNTKKVKLRITEFEVTNVLCKLLRTDNEFTRKLAKFVKKTIGEKTE